MEGLVHKQFEAVYVGGVGGVVGDGCAGCFHSETVGFEFAGCVYVDSLAHGKPLALCINAVNSLWPFCCLLNFGLSLTHNFVNIFCINHIDPDVYFAKFFISFLNPTKNGNKLLKKKMDLTP